MALLQCFSNMASVFNSTINHEWSIDLKQRYRSWSSHCVHELDIEGKHQRLDVRGGWNARGMWLPLYSPESQEDKRSLYSTILQDVLHYYAPFENRSHFVASHYMSVTFIIFWIQAPSWKIKHCLIQNVLIISKNQNKKEECKEYWKLHTCLIN